MWTAIVILKCQTNLLLLLFFTNTHPPKLVTYLQQAINTKDIRPHQDTTRRACPTCCNLPSHKPAIQKMVDHSSECMKKAVPKAPVIEERKCRSLSNSLMPIDVPLHHLWEAQKQAATSAPRNAIYADIPLLRVKLSSVQKQVKSSQSENDILVRRQRLKRLEIIFDADL